MVQSKMHNQFTLEEAIGRAAIAIVAHPFDYVKSLIQLGYEPLPAQPVTTLFRSKRLGYPNVFSYLGFIKQQDGTMGMFRGLRYKLAFTLVNGYVHVNLSELLKQMSDRERAATQDEDDDSGDSTSESRSPAIAKPATVKDLIDQLMRETFCKFVTLSISYPFQLLVLRSYAQFVGHEQVYDTFTGAVSEIYKQSGITGFYAGFVPKFFGDVLILWTSHGLIFVAKRFVEGDSTIQGYIAATINFVVASFLYPFSVVSTVMAVNGPAASSLAATALNPDYACDWAECWRHLSQLGEIKRGSSLFWRYQPNRPLLVSKTSRVEF